MALNLAFVSDIQSAKTIMAKRPESRQCAAQVLDGKETPLYDLSAVFEQQIVGLDSAQRKLIMVKTDKYDLGLIVDGVEKVVSAHSSRIEPLPRVFKGSSKSCFPSVLKYKDRLFLIISPEGIANLVTRKTVPPDVSNDRDPVVASPLTKEDNLAQKA